MSKKKDGFSIIEILWRIVAPVFVAVCHTLWNVYGEAILAALRRAFTL